MCLSRGLIKFQEATLSNLVGIGGLVETVSSGHVIRETETGHSSASLEHTDGFCMGHDGFVQGGDDRGRLLKLLAVYYPSWLGLSNRRGQDAQRECYGGNNTGLHDGDLTVISQG